MRNLLIVLVALTIVSCNSLKKSNDEKKDEVKTTENATAEIKAVEMNEIKGKTWYWVQTIYNNDTKLTPKDKSSFIIFNDEGKLAVKGDCNKGSSSYTINEKTIEIKPIMATKMYCGGESKEKDFFKNLMAAAIIFTKDGKLYIDLKADSGTMEFVSE